MKKIVLTGGGTAGHVTPNLALIPQLKKEGWKISYIGTHNGIERNLIEKEGIDYYPISSGKLRRYFSVQNFTDAFRVIRGVSEASVLIKKIKPDVVFSKGGFVAVPVVLGAKLHRIPVIAHESDMTPGLANKIAMPFAEYICTTFPETASMIPKKKGINTGTPIRAELFQGNAAQGRKICNFDQSKPVILMMGGSLGSVKINDCLRQALPVLLQEFQVVHICGKGNQEESLKGTVGYCQFEYVSEELPHILAMADGVLSRAGSNSISEFLALQKPNLLVPLSAHASRGDQILNAASFEKQGFSLVLQEEEMTKETLVKKIKELYQNRSQFQKAMKNSPLSDGVGSVMELLRTYQNRKI